MKLHHKHPQFYKAKEKNEIEYISKHFLEGSSDNEKWTTLVEQKNKDYLNGKSFVHSFVIPSDKYYQQSFKYLRIRQTGPNWNNNSNINQELLMNCIEFFGQLI